MYPIFSFASGTSGFQAKGVDDGVVAPVWTVDRVEYQHAVLDRSAHWTDLVHRPAGHGAVTADTAVGGAETRDPVDLRWRNDRAVRLGADCAPTRPAAVADPGPAEDPLEPFSRFHGVLV